MRWSLARRLRLSSSKGSDWAVLGFEKHGYLRTPTSNRILLNSSLGAVK